MSLILDALNKAEREQDFDPNKVPDLQTVHPAGVPTGSPSKAPWLWMVLAAVVALAFAVVLILYLQLLGGKGSEKAPVPESKVSAEDASDTNVPASQLVKNAKPLEGDKKPSNPASVNTLPASSALPAAPSEVAELYATQVEAMRSVPDPLPVATVNDAVETVEAARAQAIWDELERERELLHIEPEPQPVTQAKAASVQETAETVEPEGLADDQRLAYYEDVPFLHKLPVLFQNEIPTLMYNLHEFEQGSVIINKKRYQTGSTLPNGVVVEQVLYDGVLLNYSGRQFKLSALNSWVNF